MVTRYRACRKPVHALGDSQRMIIKHDLDEKARLTAVIDELLERANRQHCHKQARPRRWRSTDAPGCFTRAFRTRRSCEQTSLGRARSRRPGSRPFSSSRRGSERYDAPKSSSYIHPSPIGSVASSCQTDCGLERCLEWSSPVVAAARGCAPGDVPGSHGELHHPGELGGLRAAVQQGRAAPRKLRSRMTAHTLR
jgi:hypothetical protein